MHASTHSASHDGALSLRVREEGRGCDGRGCDGDGICSRDAGTPVWFGIQGVARPAAVLTLRCRPAPRTAPLAPAAPPRDCSQGGHHRISPPPLSSLKSSSLLHFSQSVDDRGRGQSPLVAVEVAVMGSVAAAGDERRCCGRGSAWIEGLLAIGREEAREKKKPKIDGLAGWAGCLSLCLLVFPSLFAPLTHPYFSTTITFAAFFIEARHQYRHSCFSSA
ncbi:uncharacterized protein PSFLO_01339 [Pseudozyma flocculosa]|uniref:Uncharacterized protein n=1 Tax=Pseudozyma flocculosa TaxID=84751 RepID=A0A5C3EU83_9BASI|nr:uncharacterized protein PSFLO_01339 [Pseudozyma flocculosa]